MDYYCAFGGGGYGCVHCHAGIHVLIYYGKKMDNTPGTAD
jgi:hypothetical protein